MDTQIEQNRPVEPYVIDPSIKLDAKRAKFVYEYLIDYNGTQAAIRAGYAKKSAKVTASRLLTNDNVKRAIDDGKMYYMLQNGMDAHWIRQKRLELLERCMQAEPVMIKIDGEWVESGEYQFKDATVRNVLADMAKDAGMDVGQVNVNVGGSVHHDHTVREQIDFTEIRSKVDKHKTARAH